ncbi:hypothetical protein S40285_10697, partial [Stachybotrys chlorohalonatus IBT 40285]
MYRRL